MAAGAPSRDVRSTRTKTSDRRTLVLLDHDVDHTGLLLGSKPDCYSRVARGCEPAHCFTLGGVNRFRVTELPKDRVLVVAQLTSADALGQTINEGADVVEFDGELELPLLSETLDVVTIPAGDEDFTLAAATVAAMSGARAIRASDVRQARKVVEMVASVTGTRPPARAVRALA